MATVVSQFPTPGLIEVCIEGILSSKGNRYEVLTPAMARDLAIELLQAANRAEARKLADDAVKAG